MSEPASAEVGREPANGEVGREPANGEVGREPANGEVGREPANGERIERPEPGLARGRWEAPAWFFYAVFVAAVVGGLAWLAIVLRARRHGAPR